MIASDFDGMDENNIKWNLTSSNSLTMLGLITLHGKQFRDETVLLHSNNIAG